MHSVYNGNRPAYLSDIVQTVSASRPHLHLGSSSSTDCMLPWFSTKFGECTFSYAGPSAWHRLLEDIRAESDIASFSKLIILVLRSMCVNCIFNQCTVSCTRGLIVMGGTEILYNDECIDNWPRLSSRRQKTVWDGNCQHPHVVCNNTICSVYSTSLTSIHCTTVLWTTAFLIYTFATNRQFTLSRWNQYSGNSLYKYRER